MEDEDELPQLAPDTLRLLQEFTAEKEAHQKSFEAIKARSEATFDDAQNQYNESAANGSNTDISMDLFTEDWNASQFWYTPETATTIASAILNSAKEDSAIAIVSAPSVYVALKKLLDQPSISASETDAIPVSRSKPQVYLLEYDTRFAIFGQDFVHYDFQHPLRLPAELKGRFDRIICDPPFLSEDCQTKTALTVRWLARSWVASTSASSAGQTETASDGDQGLSLVMCTGERMEAVVHKLYAKVGVRTTDFGPVHACGLSNEFLCYANFKGTDWSWRG